MNPGNIQTSALDMEQLKMVIGLVGKPLTSEMTSIPSEEARLFVAQTHLASFTVADCMPEGISLDALDLMQSILVLHASDRPDAATLLSSTFFNNVPQRPRLPVSFIFDHRFQFPST